MTAEGLCSPEVSYDCMFGRSLDRTRDPAATEEPAEAQASQERSAPEQSAPASGGHSFSTALA
jgi:hypothetical protein